MSTNDCVNSGLTYTIRIDAENCHKYKFKCNQDRLQFDLVDDGNEKTWATLGYHQCPNCTLKQDDVPLCPVALNLSGLLKDWNNTVSYANVDLTVESGNRTISAQTTAQKALGSLLGLIMATSDCPHTQFFRPMAQFHLPLATSEETSFRAISTYLLTLFFRKQAGEEVNFELSGLAEIYENMHELNIHIKKRLTDAVEQDAALNAVMLLDVFTITTTNFLDDELEKLKSLFSIL